MENVPEGGVSVVLGPRQRLLGSWYPRKVVSRSTAHAVGWVATCLVAGCGPVDDDGGDANTRVLSYANDIRLVRLAANQGVQATLVADGVELLDPVERGIDLLTRRTTLMQGFWSLHVDFVPRALVGRLTIDYPNGRRLVREHDLFVEGPSDEGTAGASFYWLLAPEEVVAGMEYRARILEADAAAPAPLYLDGEVPPVAPLHGPGELVAYDSTLRLTAIIVPILHRFGGCERKPEVTEGDLLAMATALEQLNPVHVAELTLGDPVAFDGSIGELKGFGPILAELAATRAANPVAPEAFYYGVIDSCDGYPAGLAGQAITIAGAPTMGNAQERIAVGRWNGSGANAASTFVHELGHAQGRMHVRCSGGEAGIDPQYPHSGGRIGTWGFGIHDRWLRPPSGRDYMTYCGSEWVSDYGWQYSLSVLDVLSGFSSASAGELQALVAGILYPDGTSQWWLQRGALDPLAFNAELVDETHPGEPLAKAVVRPVADAEHTFYVQAPWNAQWERAAARGLHIRGNGGGSGQSTVSRAISIAQLDATSWSGR